MASTSRPVRVKNQPSRNKDNVELNLQLIEKLEANRVNVNITKSLKNANTGSTNYAKILSSFVNSINEQYRVSLSKLQAQKNEKSVSKNKTNQVGDQAEWGPSKEKKKYVMGSTTRGYTKTLPQPSSVSEKQLQKPNIEQQKSTRMSRVPQSEQPPTSLPPARNPQKQLKKPLIITPAPQAPIERKPFKRASYHIGIAYTIYIEQLKEANPGMVDHRKCDPTFYAKKLKAEQSRKIEILSLLDINGQK